MVAPTRASHPLRPAIGSPIDFKLSGTANSIRTVTGSAAIRPVTIRQLWRIWTAPLLTADPAIIGLGDVHEGGSTWTIGSAIRQVS